MLVIGLTGSIGMGKTVTAGLFRERGVPVYDADAAVHALYGGEAAPLIEAAFPGTVQGGVVDRAHLGQAVLGDAAALQRLEAIVHPLVREAEKRFLARCQAEGHTVAVLDIPLLLETRGERRCDLVVVVSAAPEVQRARVLARPGMTPERFEAILARQMPDAQKRRLADAVIPTDQGLEVAERAVDSLLAGLAAGGPGSLLPEKPPEHGSGEGFPHA